MGLVAYAGIYSAIKQVQAHQLKPLLLDMSSKGAGDVEKGNKLFLLGKFKDAASAYDDAASADQESPIPWLNGGLTAKEMGKLGIAKLSVNTAFHLGDQSARGKVISADIDLARKQFEPSKSKFGQALFEAPNDPFALSGFAQWNMRQAHLREGERFMWQGYRQGAPVVMDSVLHDKTDYTATGGTGDGAVVASAQLMGKDASAAFDAGLATQTVGGSALQQLAKFDFAIDTPFGVLAANHRDLESDRPGLNSNSLLLPSTPGSRLDFRHTMIGLQNRLGDFTFHANYRQEFSSVRTGPFAPFADDNRMHQYIFESRYDSGNWMGGAGYSKVSKTSVASPGIEPLEALFPQGTTNLYNGYIVNRQDVSKNIKFTSGGIFTSALGDKQAGVMGQLAIRTIGNRYLKFGIKPGINRVQTNLGPINDMLGSLGTNSLDRLEGSALEFNRDISIPRVNGRMTNAYASIPLAGSLVLGAFQNSFSNQNFIGADPQTSPQLNLTPVKRGQVSGVTLENTMAMGNSMNLRLLATAQSSSGTYGVTTRSLSSGIPAEVKVTEMPNIPRFEVLASFDWSLRNSTLAVSANYVGARTIMTRPEINAAVPPGSYVSRANPGTRLDVHYSLALGSGNSFDLTLMNIANNPFFPGSRSSRQVILGYTSRQ